MTLAVERPRTTPGPVFIVQFALFFIQLILFNTVLHVTTQQGMFIWAIEMVIPAASLVIIARMPMRDPLLASDGICPPYQTPTSSLRSPEDNFTLWNWMSVGWMGPTVKIACERQLHDEDVWILPLEFQHSRLHRLFRDVQGSVLVRLLKANAPDLIITTCTGILESLCSLVPVIFLKQLLLALEGETPNRKAAMIYGVFILMGRLISAQSGLFSLWYCRRCYERCRGELITMIYEKTLMRKAFTFPSTHNDSDTEKQHGTKLSQDGPASMGKILNLMRNDVYEVAQRFWEFANLVTKPMTFILTIVLIWKILGPAALGGVVLIVSAQVMNIFIIRALVSWERARRAVTDVKLQVTSQFVESIRHLRWYDWQDKWLGQILESRRKELRYRVIVNLISKAVAATNKISAYFFPVAAFYAYTIIGNQPLRVDVAFPALTLFTQLNQSLNELPGLITVLLNASVAMGRIERFMAEPNKDAGDPGAPCERGTHPTERLVMSFKDASFSWPGSPSSKQVLSNVSFNASTGLTAICGKVGSGKTALLHAVLGELDDKGGVREVPNEMMGYCAQTPWLQSMSIRENILFSAGFDEARYRQVLAACCLIPDLANWKAGDLSLIGENGVGLSGGQRARVALARAVYSQARVLLLDDPIAALDHQTAETILRNLFTNTHLMEGRMVLFVTHRMDILTRYADQVLEISPQGTVTVISREDIKNHEELFLFAAQDEKRRASVDDARVDDTDAAADEDVIPDKFIEEEYRAHGGVIMSVYWKYIKAGNLRFWAFLVMLFSVFRASRLAHYYFLKLWGESYDDNGPTTQMYLLVSNEPDHYFKPSPSSAVRSAASGDWWSVDLGLPPPDTDARPWLFWFFVIALFQFVSYVLSDLTIVLLIYTAGKHLFEEVMHKVANATFRFYDVTPVGRLMNRLTSDIGTIDGQIVTQIRDVAWYFMFWASSLFVIASTTPAFLVIAIFMTTTFILIFRRFLPASQSLRRLEMVSLSPLMSNFGTLLEGLTTVRAFRAQPHFQNQIIITTDAFQKMDHFFWSLQGWLMFRFDILSAFSTFILTTSAIFTGLSAGTVGFVLGTAANFVSCTHNLCRKYGDLQMQFVSVERVIELMDLEQEPRGDLDPPAAWPSYDDEIVYDNVTVRYAPGLEPSLRNISFRIPAGAMVAVTGRTGSGKSTLALTLLGTILPELDETVGTLGSIRIGNIDVARVNKHALRKRISFVAQDPVLFPGTLRDNLDPIGEYSDEECALVLRRVLGFDQQVELGASGSATPGSSRSISDGASSFPSSGSHSSSEIDAEEESNGQTQLADGENIPSDVPAGFQGDGVATADEARDQDQSQDSHHTKSASSSSQLTLTTPIDGGGKNLSQGQRQLIGLGRAVLRRSPVIILDEATASIDKKTAFYIQQVLREELKQSTVITIAHRVEAVKGADFEIVLDKGKIVKAQPIREG